MEDFSDLALPIGEIDKEMNELVKRRKFIVESLTFRLGKLSNHEIHDIKDDGERPLVVREAAQTVLAVMYGEH
jgi:hypothetical protein